MPRLKALHLSELGLPLDYVYRFTGSPIITLTLGSFDTSEDPGLNGFIQFLKQKGFPELEKVIILPENRFSTLAVDNLLSTCSNLGIASALKEDSSEEEWATDDYG